MWFWWFMFVCGLMTPMLMIISGRMMWKHAPKSINGIVGYRTARSMKNKDTWEFAHHYCGQLWWKIGWIMLMLSCVMLVLTYSKSVEVIGTAGGILCIIQCIVLIASIFPTEKALKRNFTDEGRKIHL